jgi:hypothetical protein
MVIRNNTVALQQYSANNIPKRVEVEGTLYEPSLRNNVILVWVAQEDAEKIINSPLNTTKSCNCNNGTYKPMFYYASEINVSIHETGHMP